jgi:hypothetical protein
MTHVLQWKIICFSRVRRFTLQMETFDDLKQEKPPIIASRLERRKPFQYNFLLHYSMQSLCVQRWDRAGASRNGFDVQAASRWDRRSETAG